MIYKITLFKCDIIPFPIDSESTSKYPNDKMFPVPNIDLPPLCSPHFRPGPPSEQAQILNQFFADIILK